MKSHVRTSWMVPDTRFHQLVTSLNPELSSPVIYPCQQPLNSTVRESGRPRESLPPHGSQAPPAFVYASSALVNPSVTEAATDINMDRLASVLSLDVRRQHMV